MSNFKSLAFIAATAALLSACSTPVKVAETPVVERAPEKSSLQLTPVKFSQ